MNETQRGRRLAGRGDRAVLGQPLAVAPSAVCAIHATNGPLAKPTWSPDGTSLAWQDAKGIWVGRVGDLSGQACQLTQTPVVPGGSRSDWGRRDPDPEREN